MSKILIMYRYITAKISQLFIDRLKQPKWLGVSKKNENFNVYKIQCKNIFHMYLLKCVSLYQNVCMVKVSKRGLLIIMHQSFERYCIPQFFLLLMTDRILVFYRVYYSSNQEGIYKNRRYPIWLKKVIDFSRLNA